MRSTSNEDAANALGPPYGSVARTIIEEWTEEAREAREAANILVPSPPPSPEDAEIERLEAVIAELRAVLAPLLDDWDRPSGCDPDGCEVRSCVFCGADPEARWVHDPPDCTPGSSGRGHAVDETRHGADCPVPRKDELLGRA